MPYPLERQKKMRKEISVTLKTLRQRFELTQQQISNVLGVDRSSYSYMENGKVMPSIEALLVFSKIYGLPVDILLGRKAVSENPVKERFALTKEERTLLINYREVSEKKQKQILARIAELCGGKKEK